jgi:CDP-glucose 4,6-dehydratase
MISDLKAFYQGKKVVVTGHTGFKGAWLSLWLSQMGAEVTGYSLDPPSEPNLFSAIALEEKINHIHGDIRNQKELQSAFDQASPDLVFHLAAQSLVRQSYSDPHLTYETNVMGSVNLFEAVRKNEGVRAFVNVTSDKCYENREQNWWGYRERDPMGGYDPYSSSKGCSELISAAYIRSFFNPADYGTKHNVGAASVRAGNVIGGGDWGKDRLIPDCIRALTAGEEIVIRSPAALRPWQFVFEPLRGYLLLGMKLFTDGARFSGGWNFGPVEVEKWTVEDVVGQICRLWGSGDYKVQPDSLHEAGLLWLDSSKARQELNYRPAYLTKKALEETVHWYRIWSEKPGTETLLKFSCEQLLAYEQEVQGQLISEQLQ